MNRDRRRALLFAYLLLTIHYSLPQNKKPGVERRVQPPTLGWLHAMLDFVLACARKEPHYRIYFWPSLGITLGRRFFDPTVMPYWLNYPRAICKYTHFSVFVKSPQ